MLNLTDSVLNITSTYRDAEDVVSLDSQLAVTLPSPSQLTNPVVESNRYNRTRLHQKMPSLAWDRVLAMLNIENETIVIHRADYYRLLDRLIISQPLKIWKNKVRFTILHRMAAYLSDDFLDTRFTMFDQVINGQQERRARWMMILNLINGYIADSVGQLYVAKYFPEKTKEHFTRMVNSIADAFAERISSLPWLSQATKTKSLRKLKAMGKKVGYPSKWACFDSLTVNPLSYFESVRNIFQYSYEQKIRRLGKKVDREQWSLTAQTADAAYVRSSSDNEILQRNIVPCREVYTTILLARQQLSRSLYFLWITMML